MPRWIRSALLVLAVLALLPAALISRARTTSSATPRINLIPDMDYQPKYLPQTENRMFLDGRAMRPPIEGTIARGELAENDHYERGRVGGDWATTFPVPVTGALMARGKQRFEIFCAPCHGLGGYGDGAVSLAANRLMEVGEASWTQPTSLHDDTVRERPLGHLFNTISNGIRTMPPYGSQIPTAERWAILAYLRALQRSSKATLSDVPAEIREQLQLRREEHVERR